MRRSLLVWPVLLSAAASSGLAAQRIDSPYRFVEHGQGAGLYGGMMWPSEGRIGLGPQSAAGAGVRYGIAVSGPISVELDLFFSPTTRAIGDTILTLPDSLPTMRGDGNMKMLVGMGSIRFNLTGGRTWHGLQPFAVFGGGLATDVAPKPALQDSVPATARFDFGTSFAGQLGAGLEWYPTARWSLRLDARNVLWKLKYPPAFQRVQGSRPVPADEWESNKIVSVGLSMHF